MAFPWISRGHYDDVMAVKNAIIRTLENQNAVLAARLAEPVAVTVTLPRDFAVIAPAMIRTRHRSPEEQPATPSTEINWENLDENDPVTVARIAAQELGGSVSPYVLSRKVDSIRHQIREARRKKLSETVLSGRVGTIAPPASEKEAADQGPDYVPSFIRNLIEQAENK